MLSKNPSISFIVFSLSLYNTMSGINPIVDRISGLENVEDF